MLEVVAEGVELVTILRVVVILGADDSVVDNCPDLDAAEGRNFLLPMRTLLILPNTLSNEVGTKRVFLILVHFLEELCCKSRLQVPGLPWDMRELMATLSLSLALP